MTTVSGGCNPASSFGFRELGSFRRFRSLTVLSQRLFGRGWVRFIDFCSSPGLRSTHSDNTCGLVSIYCASGWLRFVGFRRLGLATSLHPRIWIWVRSAGFAFVVLRFGSHHRLFLPSLAHPEHRRCNPISLIIETPEGFGALGSRKSMERNRPPETPMKDQPWMPPVNLGHVGHDLTNLLFIDEVMGQDRSAIPRTISSGPGAAHVWSALARKTMCMQPPTRAQSHR
jgi:hypothetical protein